jgi:hypothetical protein
MFCIQLRTYYTGRGNTSAVVGGEKPLATLAYKYRSLQFFFEIANLGAASFL